MKQRRMKNEKGFSLIEIIVVLIILAIMAAGLGNVVVFAVQNFIFAREANQLSQKAQLALARMKSELVDLTSVNSANTDNSSIQYTLSTGETYRIQFSGNQITLEKINPPPAIASQTLINGVVTNNDGNNFLTYYQTNGTTEWLPGNPINQLAQIRVVIVLSFQPDNQNLTFQTTINPRKNTIPNAPSLNP
jgi:prepilin-type N-terminal cleavage/methylation domain-containing protein